MNQAAACLRQALRALPANASVLDAGCGDFRIYREFADQFSGKEYVGCDHAETLPPLGASFSQWDLERFPLPFEDDRFDFAILSHVLEHVGKPVDLLRELVRVLKPGGALYVECPSERSLKPGWWAPEHYNLILSFHDDPTHSGRPWSPQALRRTALYMNCEPRIAKHDRSFVRWLRLPLDWTYGLLAARPDHMVDSWWQANGWVTYALIRKPDDMRGAPGFNYYSFKGRPVGPSYRP